MDTDTLAVLPSQLHPQQRCHGGWGKRPQAGDMSRGKVLRMVQQYMIHLVSLVY